MQLTGRSRAWHFLSSLSARGRLAHPIPAAHGTFPALHLGFYGMKRWKVTDDRSAPAQTSYRRRARRPGPGASSTAGSRRAPPGPGRAPRRSGALAAPGASARGPSACTGRHSRSRGSRTPRCKGELKNSRTALSGRPRARPLPPPRPAPVRRKSGQGRGHWLRCPAAGLMAGHLPQGQEGGSEPGTHPAETQRPAGDPLILLPAWVRALLWVPLDFSCSLPWREPFLLEQ